MRISFFCLLVLIVGLARAAVPKQKANSRQLSAQDVEDNTRDNTKSLLSTLQEIHRSLISEIDVLQKTLKTSRSVDENTEMMHLVQHYTAQKNNIEREISLIQSIEANPTSATAPRHILRNHSPEEKIVPALFNIFKKGKTPNADQFNGDNGYSLPYPPYYISGPGPQYGNPYHGPPPIPNYPFQNGLIEDTFPGHEPPQYNHNLHQEFTNRAQPSVGQPSLQINEQFSPAPQIMLQPQVQPPQPRPLRSQIQLQSEVSPPVLEGEAQPQPSEVDALTNQQQAQNGQKQGVFIYYPNGVVNEDRPSIADRFGQAIDRFGQAISNLANRQTLRSPSDANNIQKSAHSPTKHRVRNSRPRSASNENPKARKLEDKPKSAHSPSMHRVRNSRPRSASNENPKARKLEDKPKLRWVSI